MVVHPSALALDRSISEFGKGYFRKLEHRGFDCRHDFLLSFLLHRCSEFCHDALDATELPLYPDVLAAVAAALERGVPRRRAALPQVKERAQCLSPLLVRISRAWDPTMRPFRFPHIA
jgi:hypothetical protein